MRIETSTWYECKLRYNKTTEAGELKKTTEIYVVDALSFTEAENKLIDEAASILVGEFEVKGLNEASYHEVLFSDDDKDDVWFKVKLCFLTYNEKSGKEKKSSVLYLVQADNINNAMHSVKEMMRTSMTDYSIQSIVQTNIIDVFNKK